MKTAEYLEQEIFQELYANGDLIDDSIERFMQRREGIISGRITEYATEREQKWKELIREIHKLNELCEAPQYHEVMSAKGAQKKVVAELEKELGLNKE